jgi:hypothetical protein
MVKCKNCGHELQVMQPYAILRRARHLTNGGSGHAIICECGCTKPEPEGYD